jgi:hypothetical protein
MHPSNLAAITTSSPELAHEGMHQRDGLREAKHHNNSLNTLLPGSQAIFKRKQSF